MIIGIQSAMALREVKKVDRKRGGKREPRTSSCPRTMCWDFSTEGRTAIQQLAPPWEDAPSWPAIGHSVGTSLWQDCRQGKLLLRGILRDRLYPRHGLPYHHCASESNFPSEVHRSVVSREDCNLTLIPLAQQLGLCLSQGRLGSVPRSNLCLTWSHPRIQE